ncbi:MAG: tRNA-dihydrouridine synthase, partial [Pseudomonadota bacterium]
NGNIDSPQQAAAVLAHTKAAGVMIGRAAQGRPWLPGQIAQHLETGVLTPDPSVQDQATILLDHVAQLHTFYGDYMGLRIARKHVGWYLQGLYSQPLDQAPARAQQDPCYRHFKAQFNALEDAQQQLRQLQQYFQAFSEDEVLAA